MNLTPKEQAFADEVASLIDRVFGTYVDRRTVIALRTYAEDEIARVHAEEVAAEMEAYAAYCAYEDAADADYRAYRRACAEGRAAEYVQKHYATNWDDIPF